MKGALFPKAIKRPCIISDAGLEPDVSDGELFQVMAL